MSDITLDQIIEWADTLSPQDQTQLMAHLLDVAKKRHLTSTEKMTLLKAVQIDIDVIEEPSIRREDWYGEDGR
ncbi:MAG: hypothetical protein SFZ02_18480 [bacterium]|nr:hypothetical protein [bacterium]